MTGFLKGLRAILILTLLSPFILLAVVFSFIQRFGGIEAEETLIGKLTQYL